MNGGNNDPAGGRIVPLEVGAIIREMIKYAVAAMPVPGMDENKPIEPFESKDIDSSLEKLGVEFHIPMRDLDGRAVNTKVEIRSKNDFEEENLIRKISLLSELEEEVKFLENFQVELRQDESLKKEIDELIDNETNYNRFLLLLDNWISDLSQNESRFIEILKNKTQQ